MPHGFIPGRRRIAGATMVLLVAAALSQAQTPGDNVNMVAGTQWPGGDPFLQRQNEPSIAVSSRNPLHLLAGANDYRTIDLPDTDAVPDEELSADAWLGVFKSYDGGQTWQSTLLPGYPQDHSTIGNASPLKAYLTAADPTIRAGTHGMFYESGIAFNRGSNVGAVFITTFLDQNNKENGDVPAGTDPIRYLGTVLVDTGNAGQFLDKPWLAIDIPRAGAGTCALPVSPTQSIPAGNVYLAWTRITGNENNTDVMFSRSVDCGQHWDQPIKISEGNHTNQGAVIAVDPVSGKVYAAWRRFADTSISDGVVFAMSSNFGQKFTKSTEIAKIIPFTQETTNDSFRTNAMPTMAVSVDSANVSRIHVAWAGRQVVDGDARIMMATSTGGSAWSTPAIADPQPIVDDPRPGADPRKSFNRGHQFMPSLTFAAGKLMLLYYDQRLDHTLAFFDPVVPFPAGGGKLYFEEKELQGELQVDPADSQKKVFTPTISDAGLDLRRHTIDVRVAQANPGAVTAFSPSAAVSRYRFGIRGDESGSIARLQQLGLNPPNLPLFQQGTVPFLGDYIDIAGQAFLPPVTPGGTWRFNTAAAKAPVFYATWTSNQDVRPPADGRWDNYTPVGGPATSVFDGSMTPACVPGQAGMRNQNIYLSRITQGLLVTSPQNAKRLKPLDVTKPNHNERAFVLLVQNETDVDRTFRLGIESQPVGGAASFVADAAPNPTCPFPSPSAKPCTALDVQIAAHSSIARSVFATSTNSAAQITVSVAEIGAVGDPGPLPGGLSSSLQFNPEGTVTDLTQPDGTDPVNQDISILEVYQPFIGNAVVDSANVEGHVANGHVANATVATGHVANGHVANGHVANPDVANGHVANSSLTTSNVAEGHVANSTLSDSSITAAPVTDATFNVVNEGNTTHSYHVKLVGQQPSPDVHLQLIIGKTYYTPYPNGCTLELEPHTATVVNVVQPEVSDPGQVFDPNIPDPRISNATLTLAPGESAAVTLRGLVDVPSMTQVANRVWPRVIAHAGDGTNNPHADPLVASTSTDLLPPLVVGVPYNATLQASGGTPPYTWSLGAGSLPPDLTLAPSGQISGTPKVVGSFDATVLVSDSNATGPQTASQPLTFNVSSRPTTTAVAAPTTAVVGQTVTVSTTVRDTGAGTPTGPTGSVSLTSTVAADAFVPANSCGLGAAATNPASCSVTLTPLAAGARTLSARYAGDNTHAASDGATTMTVAKANTTTAITVAPVAVVGQQVTVSVAVAVQAPGSGLPTGAVSVSDGGSNACSLPASPAGASCSFVWTSVGSRTLTASYGGDAGRNGSSGTATVQVGAAITTTTITSDSPDPSGVGQAVTVNYSVAVVAPGVGTPSGIVTVSDGVASCSGSVTAGKCSITLTTAGARTLTATYAGDASFSGSAGTAAHQVKSPYTFTGFQTPLVTAGTLAAPSSSGSQTFTRVLPLKWQLKNASGTAVTSLTSTTLLSATYGGATCPAPGPAPAPTGTTVLLYSPTQGAAGGSTFRYSGGFIFNWDATKNATKGCWWIRLQLDDASPEKVTTVLFN